MNLTLKLNAGLGVDLGPNFNLTTTVGSVVPSTATKTELLAGKVITVNNAAVSVTVNSLGPCTNSLTIPITL